MKMQFLGAARTVTGSSILVDTGSEKILVDCGLFQGIREIEEMNYLGFDYQPADIDFVLLTHAHIDHSGLLPRLWKLGFTGKIVTTAATADMCRVMLLDSASIHERDAEQKSKRRKKEKLPGREPLYRIPDAEGVLQLFHGFPYNQRIEISRNLAVRFRDAGHILGSASVELWASDGDQVVKLGFSGDLGNHPTPLLREPQPVEEADYLVIESTYGDRLHEHDGEDKVEALRKIIVETVDRGGRLIIPAFAVGRTQEILYHINQFVESGTIPALPVFVDSPMATSATEIYRRHTECYDEDARILLERDDSPFEFTGLKFVRDPAESRRLNDLHEPCIIISASGMATNGRIRHHLVHGLGKERNTVLFVGYQGFGTLGRTLLDGAPEVRIFGEDLPVRASIKSITGFSAHADKNGLLRWLQGLQEEPQMVFVNHGEEDQSVAFAESIHQQLGLSATVPEPKAGFNLELRPARAAVAPAGAVRRPPLPLPLRREASRFERESQNLETRLRKLFAELSTGMSRVQPAGAAKEGVQATTAMLDELHQSLERLVEAVVEGTEATLRRELESLGLKDTKPWSELLRLIGSRRRTVLQSHEELRTTILKLAERLQQP